MNNFSDQTPEDLNWIAQNIKEVKQKTDGRFYLEIGVRSGGGSLNIHNVLSKFDSESILLSVDPYGDKIYKTGTKEIYMGYSEQHYKDAIRLIAENTTSKCPWLLYRMTSTDWIHNNISIYQSKQIYNNQKIKYSAVILDGEHETKIVSKEFEYFKNSLIDGGIIIIDNISQIVLPNYKFEIFKGKALYRN